MLLLCLDAEPASAGVRDEHAYTIHVAFQEVGAPQSVRENFVRIAGGHTRKCPTGESNMNPRAVNGSHRGFFQISYQHVYDRRGRPGIVTAMGYTWDDMLLPVPNARVAAHLWRAQRQAGKSGYGPWVSCWG